MIEHHSFLVDDCREDLRRAPMSALPDSTMAVERFRGYSITTLIHFFLTEDRMLRRMTARFWAVSVAKWFVDGEMSAAELLEQGVAIKVIDLEGRVVLNTLE